jgi:hypothetical protein
VGLRRLSFAIHFLAIFNVACVALAQDVVHTFRDWEQFEPGAWKQVRLHRETFDEQGNVATTSITDTKTTLVDKDEKGFTLCVEMTVEVAGQKFPTPPQTLWYGYNGETKGQTVSTERLGNEQLEIDGHKINAELFQINVQADGQRRSIQAACSTDFPFVYRLRSTLTGPEGKQERETDVMRVEVTSIDLPYEVRDETMSVSHVRTTVQRSDSNTVTIEVHCKDVPGQVVAHWSRKSDANDRRLERSTLELLNYGTVGDNAKSRGAIRRPVFGRNRGHRVQR